MQLRTEIPQHGLGFEMFPDEARDRERCPACGVGVSFPLGGRAGGDGGRAAGGWNVGPGARREGHDPEFDRFAGTVRPVVGQLVRVARRILDCDDLAWEAVQEALLGLWQRDDQPPNPRAWLVRSVVHRSLHLRRTLRRRRDHEAKASRVRPESSDRDDPLRRVLAEEAREKLRDALARLADKHRDVIVLHMWEGLDYETIADRLQVPIGTVRSRLNRAREALRASLDREIRAQE
ncbi:RNA polymerase sigma factor [Tundrisphaera sp. TA3]|uniref:RNA polymerase sigma factor n=1 Tax=Tundrisphaera sp. TA3 TaxID=3435775 RepID=UPI003EC015B8